jgi:hypothetical protein
LFFCYARLAKQGGKTKQGVFATLFAFGDAFVFLRSKKTKQGVFATLAYLGVYLGVA